VKRLQEYETLTSIINYYVNQLQQILSHPLMVQIIYAALAFVVGVAILKTVNNMLRRMVQRNMISQSAYVKIHNVLTVIIYSLILLIIISLFTANIFLLLGTIGFILIIALSARNIFTNVLSYYAILLGKILVIGDMVSIGNVTGKVKNIGALYTEIKTKDGSIVKIPNYLVLRKALKIYSELYTVKIKVRIEAPYDLDDVGDKIRRAITSYKGVVKVAPDIRVRKLAPGYVELEVTVYTTSPEKVEHVFSDIAQEILRELKDFKVEIVRLSP